MLVFNLFHVSLDLKVTTTFTLVLFFICYFINIFTIPRTHIISVDNVPEALGLANSASALVQNSTAAEFAQLSQQIDVLFTEDILNMTAGTADTKIMFSIVDYMAQVSVEVLASTGTASKLQDHIKFTGLTMIHNLNKSAGETIYVGRSFTVTAQFINLSNEH